MAEMRLEGGPKVIYPSRCIADVRLVRGVGRHNAVIRNAFHLYACIMKSCPFFSYDGSMVMLIITAQHARIILMEGL